MIVKGIDQKWKRTSANANAFASRVLCPMIRLFDVSGARRTTADRVQFRREAVWYLVDKVYRHSNMTPYY